MRWNLQRLGLFVSLLGTGCVGPGASDTGLRPVEATQVEVDSEPALRDEVFRFCHEPGVDLREVQQWCEVLETVPDEVCPGLRASCDEKQDVESVEGCEQGEGGFGSNSSDGNGASTGPGDPVRRSSGCAESEGCGCTSDLEMGCASMMASLVKWVVALVIAFLVIGFAMILIRYFMRRKSAPERVKLAPVQVDVIDRIEPTDVPDLPSGDLLSACRAAMRDGRYGEAVLFARAAALRRLGEAGKLHIHRARTDREYARSVRGDGELHGSLRELLGIVESLRWGGLPADRQLATRSLHLVEQMLLRVGTVVLLFLALVNSSAEASTDAYSPEGSAALQTVFENQGYDVAWRLRSVRTITDEVEFLVLDATSIRMGEEDWSAVRTWVEEGGALLVAGDVEKGFPEMGVRMVPSEQAVLQPSGNWDGWEGLPVLPYGPLYLYEPSEAHVLVNGLWTTGVPMQSPVETQEGALIAYLPLGWGHVFALADERLLWNASLIVPENERLLGQIFDGVLTSEDTGVSGRGQLELALIGGVAASSTADSLFEARMLPFVVQLLLLMAVAVFWLGWLFGRPKPQLQSDRHHFAEHVRALGQRYAQLRASRRVLVAHADLCLQRIGPHGLEAAFVRAGHAREEARRRVGELVAIVNHPDEPSSSTDFTVLEDLWTVIKNP